MAPLLVLLFMVVDQGFDEVGALAEAEELERSKPPKDEARPPTPAPAPVAGAGLGVVLGPEEKEPKSPNPPVVLVFSMCVEGGGRAAAKSDMISFLPFAPDAEAEGEDGLVAVGGEGSCQSRSKMPPPPLDLAEAGVAMEVADFAEVDGAGAGEGVGEGEAWSSKSIATALLGATDAAGFAAALVVPLLAGAAGGTAAPSSTAGSGGGGPSFAHLLDSYLLLMNDSIL